MNAPGAAPAGHASAAASTAAPARAGGTHATADDPAGPADLFALLLDGLCAAAAPGNAMPEAGDTQGLATPADGAPAEGEPARTQPPAAPAEGLPAAWLQALAMPAARLPAQPAAAAADPQRGARAPAAAARPGDRSETATALAADLLAAAAATAPAASPAAGARPGPDAFAAVLANADGASTAKLHEAHGSRDETAFATALVAAAPAALPAAEPAAPAVHQAALPTHPLDAAFAGELGAQVQWMVEAGAQHAQLHLNPAELGPIQVQLSLHAQTADISFAAAHAATREGLAQALPALRELLAAQGLQLGQAGISAGQQGGQGGGGREPARRPAAPANAAAAGPVAGVGARRSGSVVLRGANGMLDLYA